MRTDGTLTETSWHTNEFVVECRGMRARLSASRDQIPYPGSTEPRLGEVLEFLRLIWAVDHALLRTSKRMEAALGISAQQRLVIRLVGRFPGIPAGHLARLLHVHPGTLTGVLRRIEKRGLVARRSDARDGRRALLGLTERGRLVDVEAEGTVEAAVQRAIEAASPAKLEAARDVLRAIARNLDPAAARPGSRDEPALSPSARRRSRRSPRP
jgi:DNA-binding MarR family transcriptional regulator